MIRYFTHDFLVESTSTNKIDGCFLYHVSLYCNNNKVGVNEDYEKFLVTVGNPDGVAHHLKVIQDIYKKSKENNFFRGPFYISEYYDEQIILQQLKEKIESISAITKRELIIKLSPFFEWEYTSDDNVISEVFN